MYRYRLLLACAGAVLLGGCQAQRSMPPVLTITKKDCVAAPALDSAVPLTFDGKKRSTQSLEIAAGAPCLTDSQGRQRHFLLLRLPGGDVPYTISVASLARGYAVFAPHIALLNAGGEMVREIDPQAIMFRGGSLTGIFRPRTGEAYLLVASNPEAVGNSFSRTVESVSVGVVPVGSGFINIYSGADTTNNYVLSHTGEIAVSIYPVPAPGKN